MDNKDVNKQVDIIKQQIDEVLKNLESIKNQTSNIQSALELSEFEKSIAKETDKLAGLLTAKTIQESFDSDVLKQQANE